MTIRNTHFLTHLWEPCQANHRKPDLYSHNNNNSFQIIQVYMEVQNMNLLRIETKAKNVYKRNEQLKKL